MRVRDADLLLCLDEHENAAIGARGEKAEQCSLLFGLLLHDSFSTRQSCSNKQISSSIPKDCYQPNQFFNQINQLMVHPINPTWVRQAVNKLEAHSFVDPGGPDVKEHWLRILTNGQKAK
jgi:hypothetical protein